MTARAATLTQADLTRYAKGMKAAGIEEWRVEIRPDKTVVIIAGEVAEKDIGPDPGGLLNE